MSHKKQIFKLNNLRNLLTEENSCVSLIPATRLLALPPFFLNDMKSGIFYLLNNMLKKYDRSLGGIIIGYQNIKVLMDENTGIIPIGTSETEVNISVEFYIFQPKIGSYLQGVINKKSNNHIGCLVHRYFNATILKPDNVDYEDWLCKDFNVDDKIIFKVIDLDFTSFLPYIEGVIDEILLDKVKSNICKIRDTDTSVVNSVNKSSHNAVLSSKEFLKSQPTSDEESEDFLKNKKEDNNSEEVSTLEDSVNKDVEINDLFINSKSKKKKKDKEKKKLLISVDHSKSNKEKSSVEEVTSDAVVCRTSENHSDEKEKHKKKKKKKKTEDVSKEGEEDSQAVEKVSKKENQNNLNCSTLEKSVQMEDQNLSSFVKLHKRKKEKKKKKDEKEEPVPFNPTSQEGLSGKEVEDNILYSTLLDYKQPEKMRIPFYSPIPQGTPVAGVKGIKTLIQALPSVQIQTNETEAKIKKKKEKKRQREENEASVFPTSKKMKTSPSSPFGKGASNSELKSEEGKSESQNIAEKLYGQQLNKVKEILSTSDKESCLEEKKKKRKSKKREKEFSDVNKKEKAQVNGESSTEKKGETKSLVDIIFQEELQRLKEELSMTDRESSAGSKKTKVKMNKSGKKSFEEKMKDSSKGTQNTEVEVNGTNEGGKKSGAQNVMDKLLKQEMNRMREDLRIFDTSNVKEAKETKVINKQETLTERSHDSLYERLLKEAKSAVALSREEPQTASPKSDFIKKKIKKNSSDLLNSSISSSKKKNLENKKKKEICPQTPDKYKNGSMYDLDVTPEKVYHDKSLFTDSEPSQVSPFKRLKEANVTETKTEKSVLQNMWVEFCKERKRLKSESDRESLKKQEKKKIKSEHKSQSSNEKEESLFDKLLKEAKSLVVSEDQCLTKKKKKKS